MNSIFQIQSSVYEYIDSQRLYGSVATSGYLQDLTLYLVNNNRINNLLVEALANNKWVLSFLPKPAVFNQMTVFFFISSCIRVAAVEVTKFVGATSEMPQLLFQLLKSLLLVTTLVI